jgi:hypothetical protein
VARQLDENLWVFDRPLRMLGLQIGTRMTAVRLPDGSLFLHSPVALDEATEREVDALGPVRHVVAPNRFHHLSIGDYRDAYGEALLWAAPGLPEKRKDIRFDGVLGDEPNTGWAGVLDQQVVHGIPSMNEVAFFHRESRSLLLTDLAMNFRETPSWLTALWLRLTGIHGRFAVSRLIRATMRDRAAARKSLDTILAWDFERVIVTHGVVLQRQGKRLLREAYDWLQDPDAAPD